MPLELHIIRASEFVRVSPHGRFNLEESRQALRTMAYACRKRAIDCALLDLRALPSPAKPLFTPTELAALVNTFREEGFSSSQRLAVLYRSDPHGGARLFAFISSMRGLQVRAFEDFEEALHWLSDGNREGPRELGEQEVPIQIARRKIDVKHRRN